MAIKKEKKKQLEEWLGTGRRKCSVAALRLRKGTGKITINKKSIDEYFYTSLQIENAISPGSFFKLDGKFNIDQFDIVANIKGGGVESQSDAFKLGFARALVNFNSDFRSELKAADFLSRDSRRKERKKYGQRGARKKRQFSKR